MILKLGYYGIRKGGDWGSICLLNDYIKISLSQSNSNSKFSKNVISDRILQYQTTLWIHNMSGCLYQMLCNVVFSGKFQLEICQNLSRGNKIKSLLNLALQI